MTPISLELVLVIAVIAFLSGVGCTAVGAGGIFVTIALFALTPLSSAEVAGTAHVIFVAVGIIGTIGFVRSGELLRSDGRSLAILLSATSILGAVAGAYLNAYVSRALFSIFLGMSIGLTGVVLLYTQLHSLPSFVTVDPSTDGGRLLFAAVGLGLGITAGLVGIGGPVIAVPALVTLGIPMLLALAVAQVQAIFISGFAAGGYAMQDAVSPVFAVIVGLPLVVGAAGGWLVAHRVPADRLELLLGILLIPTGAYLIV